MKGKRILSILVALLLVMPGTYTFASENYVLLQYCSKGNEVSRLQQQLRTYGYYKGPVDGIFGLLTENAVIKFQQDNNLIIDGIAGKQTQEALYRNNANSKPSSNYTEDDVYWLARIIQAEAGGESYIGKVAVGNVIINRVNSKEFPNTIYDVIFEYYGNIPQFSPVADGTIYNTPSQESIQAAKDALNGSRPVGNSTYFFNPAKSAGTWIVKNKTFVTKIGGHSFYA